MRKFILITLSAALLMAGACSSDSGEKAKPVEEAKPPVAPLTGLPDPDDQAAGRSALWVKIGNNPDGARPQSGLDVADVVYEEVAEGSVTRFAAVFNSISPDVAGPVRSVRDMDPAIVSQLLGVFAYSGGVSSPVSAIRAVPGLVTVNETEAEDAMERSPDRSSPDNLYAIPSKMFGLSGEPRPPRPLFEFLGDSDKFEGEDVQSLVVGFDGQFAVTYTWDESSGTFLRSYGTTPFVTPNGDQIGVTNVIVQMTEYPNASQGITVGEGEVLIFSQGRLVRGTWERGTAEDVIRYLDAQGNVIKLTPGRTWVALLPTGKSVDITTPPTTSTSLTTSTTSP